jgi:hypothetical protein
MDWQLHWLEAEGDLSSCREQITMEVAATYAIVLQLITTLRLHIRATPCISWHHERMT